jgi:hypothetical protein
MSILNSPLPSQLAEHKKRTTICEVRNPGPGLGQAQQCGGVKAVHGISSLDDLISKGNTYMI